MATSFTMAATFADQVKAITSVTTTADTTPNLDDLTLYLQEGYRDVVSQVSKYKPHELHLFARTVEITDGEPLTIESGILINAWRANGYEKESWNQCTQVNASLKFKVEDTQSLHYRGNQNPAYYWEDDTVIILPRLGTTPINFGRISSVSYEEILHDTLSVSYIPDVYTRLIAIYAAMKLIENKMAFFVLEEEDMELSSGVQANIAVLNQKYQSHFVTAGAGGGGGGGPARR